MTSIINSAFSLFSLGRGCAEGDGSPLSPLGSSPTYSDPVVSTPTGEDGGGSIPRVQPSPVYIDRLLKIMERVK